MKYNIEKALFVNDAGSIKKGFDRIYFGNEFCEDLIPSLKILKERYNVVKKAGKNFTFVTPYATDKGLDKLRRLFVFLSRQKNAEVVFNDWGVFSLLQNEFKGIIPVMGRLLTKQRRDPVMAKILFGKQKKISIYRNGKKIIILPKKIPLSLYRYYQASIINAPFFQDFILSRGINRVELDNLIWDMDISVPPELGISIYYPYGYISTGRMCWRFSLTFKRCEKQCRKYFFKMKDKSLPVTFYGIGGTLFYKFNSLPFNKLRLLNNRRIRVVYQPMLPF